MKKLFLLLALATSCHLANAQLINPQKKSEGKIAQALLDALPKTGNTGANARLDADAIVLGYPDLIKSADGTQFLVKMTAKGDIENLVGSVENLGYKVEAKGKFALDVWVPIGQINDLALLPNLAYAQANFAPMHNALVQGQGDAAMKSNLARSTYSVNGAGVKIGVMSDSYDALGGAAAGVLAGELPGTGNPFGFTTPVEVLLDAIGTSDEGRAMCEIVHEVAPGAALAVHTAWLGQQSFADGIRALAGAGCKVIVDDVFYFAEPYFQDGVIAQAVDQVKASGVAFFSAAGNQRWSSYENAYLPAVSDVGGVFSSPINLHNFGTAAAPIYRLDVTQTSRTTYGFQWDSPFKSVSGGTGTTSDLDIHVFITNLSNPTGLGTYLGSASSDNFLSGDPVEVFAINGSGGLSFLVEKFDGPNPGRLKMIGFNANLGFPTSMDNVVGTRTGTVVGHANAAGAMATGAVYYQNTPAFGVALPVAETFSSVGSTNLLIKTDGTRFASPQVRQKPEFSAPDGANNSFFSRDRDSDGIPNFSGTSAAAPHAAGLGALMMNLRNNQNQPISVDNIKTILQITAIDMDDSRTPTFDVGFDNRTGFGLIQGDVALAKASCLFPITVAKSSGILPVCEGYTVSLSATAADAIAYTWTGPANYQSAAQNPTINQLVAARAGVYTVVVNNAYGCTNSNTVKVEIGYQTNDSNAPTITSPKIIYTLGENITLGAIGCPNDMIVNWNNGVVNAGAIGFEASKLGTFTYSARCVGKCDGGKNGFITIVVAAPPAPPTITATKSLICPAETFSLLATGCDGTVVWSNGQTGTMISPIIIKTVTYTAKCEKYGLSSPNSNAQTVSIKQSLLLSSNAMNICAGESVSLSAAGCAGMVFWNYTNVSETGTKTNVSKMGTTLNVSLNTSTKFSASCSEDACIAGIKTYIDITVKDLPAIGLQSNSPVALGSAINLTVNTYGTTYAWSAAPSFTSTLRYPSIPNASLVNAGFYNVTVSDGTCSASAQIFVQVRSSSKIGSETSDFIQLSSYPVPTDEELSVDINLADASSLQIDILDITGRTIYRQDLTDRKSQHRTKFNTKALTSGMYVVKVQSENEMVTKKFLKN